MSGGIISPSILISCGFCTICSVMSLISRRVVVNTVATQ